MSKEKVKNKIKPKQEKFCQEYVIDLNGTQAAIRAGYSKKTAQEQSSRLLSNVIIQERIKELQEEARKRNELKADDVIQELRKIGFMDIGELFEGDGLKSASELSDKAKASISSIKVIKKTYGKDDNKTTEESTEYKLWDKRAALVDLGKHLGIFEKDNSQKAAGLNIVVDSEKVKKLIDDL